MPYWTTLYINLPLTQSKQQLYIPTSPTYRYALKMNLPHTTDMTDPRIMTIQRIDTSIS